MALPTTLSFDQQEIAAFCKRRHIRKLSLFGSILHEGFDAQSDIDVLVDFIPQHTPGFFTLWEIEKELSAILSNRKIDLVTIGFINPLIKEDMLEQAQLVYAQE